MNIYKISQDVNDSFYTYREAIVIAETEEMAKKTHPNSQFINKEGAWWYKLNNGDLKFNGLTTEDWVTYREVNAELLGKGVDGAQPRVILAIFDKGH